MSKNIRYARIFCKEKEERCIISPYAIHKRYLIETFRSAATRRERDSSGIILCLVSRESLIQSVGLDARLSNFPRDFCKVFRVYRIGYHCSKFDGRLEDKYFQNFSPLEREIIPRVFIYSSVLGEKIGRWMMKINRILGSPEVSSSSRCAFLLPA